MKLINGFDYLVGKPVAKNVQEWRRIVTTALRDGGQRRVDGGETFVHQRGGQLSHEIYANVSAEVRREQS